MKASWMSAWILGGLAASCGSVQEVKSQSHSGAKVAATEDDEDDGEEEGDEDIALDQVPASVKKAAEAAVPGFVLKEAEKETEKGVQIYSLEGTAGGEAVEIEVSTDGKVLEVERGEDGEDEDDD